MLQNLAEYDPGGNASDYRCRHENVTKSRELHEGRDDVVSERMYLFICVGVGSLFLRAEPSLALTLTTTPGAFGSPGLISEPS